MWTVKAKEGVEVFSASCQKGKSAKRKKHEIAILQN